MICDLKYAHYTINTKTKFPKFKCVCRLVKQNVGSVKDTSSGFMIRLVINVLS